MKKLLLCLAALAAFTAGAQTMRLSYSTDADMAHYTEFADGSTITVNNLVEEYKDYEYFIPCYLKLENLTSSPINVSMTVEPVDAESTLTAPEGPSFCSPMGCLGSLPATATWTIDAGGASAGAGFHINYVIGGANQMSPLDLDAPECCGKWTGRFTITAGGQTIRGTVVLEHASAGVDNITIDAAAPATYYNISGARIDNPAHGIYIKKQGAKASKVLVK